MNGFNSNMLDIIDKLTGFNFVYTMVRNRGITVFFLRLVLPNTAMMKSQSTGTIMAR